MIEGLTEELNIPVSSASATTLKNQMMQKGVEPDESYYIANEARVRGRDELDLNVDPPPDLAIEVDIASSSVDQLGIYASLGVPEVWLCDGVAIQVHQLQNDGTYARRDRSPAFPFLPLREVERFLEHRNAADETTWIRRFREWVRNLPRNG